MPLTVTSFAAPCPFAFSLSQHCGSNESRNRQQTFVLLDAETLELLTAK